MDIGKICGIEAINLLHRSRHILNVYLCFLSRDMSFVNEEKSFRSVMSDDAYLKLAWDCQKNAFSDFRFKSNQKSTFTDDPLIEEALGLFIIEAFSDKKQRWRIVNDMDIKKKKSLEELSRHLFLLSVCYRYFHVIQNELNKLFGVSREETFYYLDFLKGLVFKKCGDAMGYWTAKLKQLSAPREKKNKALLHYCSELMQAKPSLSATHLFRRIPEKEKAATIDGFMIYRADIDGDGEEKIYCISPTGKYDRRVGARPFSDYYKAATKKLER